MPVNEHHRDREKNRRAVIAALPEKKKEGNVAREARGEHQPHGPFFPLHPEQEQRDAAEAEQGEGKARGKGAHAEEGERSGGEIRRQRRFCAFLMTAQEKAVAVGDDVAVVEQHGRVPGLHHRLGFEGGVRFVVPQGIVPESREKEHADREEGQADQAVAGQGSRCCGCHPHTCRSRVRYWMASLRCVESTLSAPARSAMVRATLRMRS